MSFARAKIAVVGTCEKTDDGWAIEGWGFDCGGEEVIGLNVTDEAVDGMLICGFTPQELQLISAQAAVD